MCFTLNVLQLEREQGGRIRPSLYVKRPLLSVKSLLVAQHNQSQGSNSRAVNLDLRQCHITINYRDSWRISAVNQHVFRAIRAKLPPVSFGICLRGMWEGQMYRPTGRPMEAG
jgi:hypothetical protein